MSDAACKRKCARKVRNTSAKAKTKPEKTKMLMLTKCKIGVVCSDPLDPFTCREEELCYEKPMAEGQETEQKSDKVNG